MPYFKDGVTVARASDPSQLYRVVGDTGQTVLLDPQIDGKFSDDWRDRIFEKSSNFVLVEENT